MLAFLFTNCIVLSFSVCDADRLWPARWLARASASCRSLIMISGPGRESPQKRQNLVLSSCCSEHEGQYTMVTKCCALITSIECAATFDHYFECQSSINWHSQRKYSKHRVQQR